jgi:hypothetical protein
MADDRTALIRFQDRLEQSPRPLRWYARLRHASDIRKTRAMLKWDEAREEGPAYLKVMRNRLVWSFSLLCVGSVGSGLLFGEHALTLARVIRVVGIMAVPTALSVWSAAQLPKRVWAYNERLYAVYLERARALPAQAGDADPQAAA